MATEGGTFVSVTGGTIETAMPGTFVSAAGGTFETVMPGTFHSATGGTFETVLGGTIKPLPSHSSDFSGIYIFSYFMDRESAFFKYMISSGCKIDTIRPALWGRVCKMIVITFF